MLASTTNWLTPGSLFCIAIAIFTIYLLTPSSQPHYHQTGPAYGAPFLARPPSFLQRVKSFGFSHYNYNHPNPDAYLGLNYDVFGNPTDQYPAVQSVHEQDPVERVESIKLNLYKSISTCTESDADSVSYPNPQDEAPGSGFLQPARVPSFLDRVKSFNFTSIKENRESEFLPERGTTREPGRGNRSASESLVIQRTLPGKMKKSGSENLGDREDVEEVERRRPESARFERTASIGESGDVDAKADSFIRNFRMQRLESLRRYKEKIKSFNFTSISRSDSIQEKRDPQFTSDPDPTRLGRVNRSTSDSSVIQSKLPEKLKKSGSENLRERENVEEVERRRPESARTASIEESGDVDAEADNFIKRFRMQRLESFRRCKEMLKGRVM